MKNQNGKNGKSKNIRKLTEKEKILLAQLALESLPGSEEEKLETVERLLEEVEKEKRLG